MSNPDPTAQVEGDDNLSSPATSRGLFPDEVVLNIMTHLDGCTLIRCRLVSKTWKAIFDNSALYLKRAWQRICREEINSHDLHAICSSLDAKYWMIQEPWMWDKVYRCWKRWRTTVNWQWTKTRIKLPKQFRQSPVTCLKMSGNFLIIATEGGDILAYEPSCLVFCDLYSGRDILEFHLIANEPRNLYSETDFILEGLAHDELLIVCDEYVVLMDLHTGKTRTWPKFSLLTRPFGHFFGEKAFVYRQGREIIMEIKRNFDVVAKASFSSPVDIIALGKETVTSLVKHDNHFSLVFSQTKGKIIKEFKSYKTLSSPSLWRSPRVTLINENSFIIVQTDYYFMECISGNESRLYDTRRLFQCRVTHVYHHCGQVFFGTESGFFASLLLRDEKQLLELEDQVFHKITVVKEQSAVVSMFIWDDIAKPALWVAMDNKKLYRFSWFSHQEI